METLNRCCLCGHDKFFKVGMKGRFDNTVNTVVCLRCSLIFENARIGESERRTFYETEYHTIYSKKDIPDVETGKAKSLERLAFLEKYSQIKDKKILEIGCANGLFLKLCKSNGAQVLGIEPDSNYAKFGQEQFRLNVFNGTFEEFQNNPSDTFDLICLFHVMEHFSNPKKVLQWFYRKLAHDGLLYIEVPNTLTLWRWFNQSPTKFLRPVHLFNFTGSTLKCFLSQCRFKVIADDSSVSRRLRVIVVKSKTENQDYQNNNPYLVIIFFYLWYLIYPVIHIAKAIIRKSKKILLLRSIK